MKRFLLLSVLAFSFVLMAHAQLPKVQLKTLQGESLSTDTLNNNGRPFIISFFATWCKPCNRELTAISEVYPDWKDETGVKIYAVSIDQAHNIQKVKPLVDNHGWEYDVLLDPNSAFRKALNVNMIPHSFVFDGKGKMVYSHSGYQEGAEDELYEAVLKASKK